MVDFWHRWLSFQHFNIYIPRIICRMPLHFYLVSAIIENEGGEGMHFAVVDDEDAMLCQITEMIGKLSNHTLIHCDCFSDAQSFLDKYALQKYDALFLDIDMPRINGFDLTQHLRDCGDSIPIVYITGRDDLITHAFRYKALGFVRKRAMEKELSYALSTVLSELQKSDNLITIKTILSEGGCDETIRISEITYMEASHHNIIIHLLSNRTLTTRSLLSSYSEAPEFEDFILISTGILVNLAHISLKTENIAFRNGEELPISRRRIKAVREAYLKFRKKVLL